MGDKFVFVCGGTGFIGSHTIVQLLQRGEKVIVLDNLVNSSKNVIERIHSITAPHKIEEFYETDLTDLSEIRRIMELYKGKISCVIHFAGLKAVGESVSQPLEYYHNNITGTINLMMAMKENDIKNIIFSSSATVYGEPEFLPLTEKASTNITNPYGRTKLMVEEIIQDTCNSDTNWSAIILRYFNPVGAHPSGLIGEVTKGAPNNLLPYVAQVCSGKRPLLRVFGNDYSTPDGTGVRDYIHIEDLASGHIAALDSILKNGDSNFGYKIYNLGTGIGYSVLEIVDAMKKASGKEIPLEIVGRRSGDIGTCYADASLAKKELNWEATKTLTEMCEDLWKFQSANPDGF